MEMANVCQERDDTRFLILPGPIEVSGLTCPNEESHGYRCERLDPHDFSGCAVGRHTIEHSLAGNGYPCEAIDRFIERKYGS